MVISLSFARPGVVLLGLLGPDLRIRLERAGLTPPSLRWEDVTDRTADGCHGRRLGRRTGLSGSGRTIDDQVEWLDDTLLYGLPRDGVAGVADVWSLDVGQETRSTLLDEDVWSPTVIREEPRGNNS